MALGLSSVAAQDEQTLSPVAHEVTVRATLKVEAANGRALSLPTGTALRVRTANGTCLEVPLSSSVTDAVSGGGEAALPEFTIPPATTKPECAEAGKALSIELALPDGSSIVLFAGTWTADMPAVWETEFVVRPPIAQPGEVAELPPTGEGHGGGDTRWPLVALLASLAVAGAALGAARTFGRGS